MIDVLRNIYICTIALLNFYVEVEVTHTIPGVVCAEEQMTRTMTMVLQVRCVLVPNL